MGAILGKLFSIGKLIVRFTMSIFKVSLTFGGDLQIYTFWESVYHEQSKTNVYNLAKACMAAILDFQSGRLANSCFSISQHPGGLES